MVDFGIINSRTTFYQGVAKQCLSPVATNDQNASPLHIAKQGRCKQAFTVSLFSSGEIMRDVMLLQHLCRRPAYGENALMIDGYVSNGICDSIWADKDQIIVVRSVF